MGKRKRESAKAIKEARKEQSFAKLKNVPTSPRKMRLVADMVRGVDVEKLLKSAISNWEQKNGRKAEDGELYVKTIFVDCAPMLKRLRPAPQGRAYRIRKRSNHVTLLVDTYNNESKDA